MTSPFLSLLVALSAALFGATPALAGHALTPFETPRYASGFHHFDYNRPDAPKGGVLNLSFTVQNGSFDKLNPYTLKGSAAPGLTELMFETLAIYSLDEVNTQYGLLAEDIAVAPDARSVDFRLRPEARFNDGSPVRAVDVKHSFDTLTSPQASPRFQAFFGEIARVDVVDERTVRFVFKRIGRDLAFVAGSLPVFSARWGVAADGRRTPFDELRMQTPLTSGPYRIESMNDGRSISFARNPDYWGRDIGARRGTFNFDRVVYRLYKDYELQVEALKAGEYDLYREERARAWCCSFTGKRFDSGELVKTIFPTRNPPPMNGYVFNLRRKKFKDVRVRQALNLAYDFQWINRKFYYNEYERMDSFFPESSMQAKGLPSPAELERLEPFRAQLDPAVFGPMLEQPSTRPPGSLRQNLTRALALLAEAGWTNTDGVLRNARGEPFTLELFNRETQPVPFLDAYMGTLAQLGIQVQRRSTDAIAMRKRMNDFEYDFTSLWSREARTPASELWRLFNSADADRKGSQNIVGVKSPAIDALIVRMQEARTQEDYEATARALDRILMHGQYVVPGRYMFSHRVIHHQRLGRPDTLPLYYTVNDWVLNSWWVKP